MDGVWMTDRIQSNRAARLPDNFFLEVPEDFTRLDLSIAKYPPAPNVLNAIHNILTEINVYPSSNWLPLRNKLADLNHIKNQDIILVNGLDEGIDILTRTFVNPGAKVIIPTPTFSQFEIAALRQEANPLFLNFLIDSVYEFDVSKMIESSQEDNVQLIWICNPNNPTGIVDREMILEVLKNVKCLVAIDECYYEFYGETVMDLIPKFENMIVLRSFSKTYGLAGLRFGYLAGNANLISMIQKMRQPASVNLLAQTAALAVLKNQMYYQQRWSVMKQERKTLCTQLVELGFDILPSETNFVLIRTPTAHKLFQSLWDEKVYVLRGWDDAEFSGLGNDFLRITVGNPEENSHLIKSLKKIIG